QGLHGPVGVAPCRGRLCCRGEALGGGRVLVEAAQQVAGLDEEAGGHGGLFGAFVLGQAGEGVCGGAGFAPVGVGVGEEVAGPPHGVGVAVGLEQRQRLLGGLGRLQEPAGVEVGDAQVLPRVRGLVVGALGGEDRDGLDQVLGGLGGVAARQQAA